MCPQCKEIFQVWGKQSKTTEDIELLSREVPKRFTEVHRYWDEKAQALICVMECNGCGERFEVPH